MNFSVQHSKWAKYQGTIRTIQGIILFDREEISKSSVQVEMATASVDTLETGRDSELQGYGFLQGRKNPKMTFESTLIEKTGDKTGKVIGNFTMAGVTKPVTLGVIFDGEGRSDWDGRMRVGFTGLVPLDIGPELNFTIEVEATKQ